MLILAVNSLILTAMVVGGQGYSHFLFSKGNVALCSVVFGLLWPSGFHKWGNHGGNSDVLGGLLP